MQKLNQLMVAIDAIDSAKLRFQSQGRRQYLGGVGHQLDGELSNLHDLGGRERVAELELIFDRASENDEGPPAGFQHDEARAFIFIYMAMLSHPRVNDHDLWKWVRSRTKMACRHRRG